MEDEVSVDDSEYTSLAEDLKNIQNHIKLTRKLIHQYIDVFLYLFCYI